MSQRNVTSFQDCQAAFRELYAWKTKLETKDWDFKGLKIKNAGAGVDPTDYATLNQIPTLPATPKKAKENYTIVWESVGTIVVGSMVAPTYYAGRHRTGKIVEVWLGATNVPTTGPLTINLNLNGVQLLANNLTLNVGDTPPALTTAFTNPGVKIGLRNPILPLIVSVGGASLVSIGCIVELD